MIRITRHWPGLVAFLEDGRIEMDTNVVERAIRPVTLARKNALFAGSDGAARHWAIAMTLRIVLGQTKAHELDTLLPWNWELINAGVDDERLAA